MDISIAGAPLAGIIFGIAVAILAFIFIMRNRFSKGSDGSLAQKYDGSSGAFSGRNKYPEADVFGLSGTFFNLGLAISVGLIVLAFSL